MSRFDYVQWDTESALIQQSIKDVVEEAEATLSTTSDNRAKSLALTKLEEFYMRAGKAIRDDQILREKK
jgi:hypothetical protein